MLLGAEMYSCAAGWYLDGDKCTKCISGYYCPGVTDQESGGIYGLYQCPSSHPLSDTGAGADTWCYTPCTHSNTNFANAATITGNDYYGSGADTCTVASCNTGYSMRPDLTADQAINLFAQIYDINLDDLSDAEKEVLESEIKYLLDNWEEIYNSLSAEEQLIASIEIDKIQHPDRMNYLWQPFTALVQAFIDADGNDLPSDGYSYVKSYSGSEHCKQGKGIRNGLLLTALIGVDIDCDIAAQQSPELAAFRDTAQPGDWFTFSPQWGISASGKSEFDASYGIDACRAAYTNINGMPAMELWGNATDLNCEDGVGGYCYNACPDEARVFYGFSQPTLCAATKLGLWQEDIAYCEMYFNAHGAYISYVCGVNTIDIPAGKYLPAGATEPIQCPIGNYCVGMTGVIYDANKDQGIESCPDGTTSSAGATSVEQCTSGIYLHVGENAVMNLAETRPAQSPVMVFGIGDKLYYGQLSDTEKSINTNTNTKYRVRYKKKDWWLHDYTTE
jgi:hypothetical protein